MSKIARNVQEMSRIARNVQKMSRIARNIQATDMLASNVHEMFWAARKVQRCTRCQERSADVLGYYKSSEDVQGCQNVQDM